MLSQGTAFIVVSHNPYQIESLAQKVAVMHKGEMPAVREGKQALSLYHDLVQRELGRTCKTGVTPREGTGLIRFLSVKVDADSVTEYGAFQSMSPLRIVADIEANTPVTGARFRFEILSTNNVIVIKASTRGITEMRKFYGKHTLVFNMTPCQLTSGWYYIDAFASDGGLVRFDSLHKATEFKIINSSLDSLNFSNDDGIFVCHGNWCIE